MSVLENDPVIEQDSEDDFDWEEVEVPEQQQHLEITIQTTGSSKKDNSSNKNKGISHAERIIRINCHKLHTIYLLANAWTRNKWINDPLLHARLLSLTPLPLQNAFGMIHKSRVPDQNQRGRMFEAAITNLTEWWSSTFFEVTFDGHIRNQTYDSVQKKLDALPPSSKDPNSALDMEDVYDILGNDVEIIRSPKSLMKHALMQSGSRDTSAQLFTALCRALGIPARLVVSLQSVPWQPSIGKPKPAYKRKTKGKKGKGKEIVSKESQEGDDGMEVDIPGSASVSGSDIQGKGKAKAVAGEGYRLDGRSVTPQNEKEKGKAKPIIKLRKQKDKGNVLGSDPGPSSASSSRLPSPDPTTTPPVFWTEVFSRPDSRWFPIDPIRCIVNKRKAFDPSPTPSAPAPQVNSSYFPHPYGSAAQSRKHPYTRSANQENRMVYVLAFEEDGYARDVTRRYAKDFSAKIAKMQGGSSTIGGGGKARQAWWERVVGVVSRPYRLHRDDVEDEELDAVQMMEGMPTTVSGFKDHPLYVLTRHLKQTEVIHPPPPETPELGKFRGEPVYPRSAVVSLKTAENWMRSEGRGVMEGQQPLKFIKLRAGTIGRMRELEVMKDGLKEAGDQVGAGETMQGLYARNQTEIYKPDPVVNGKIPKNNFGNIDLYVPSMLPRGAVHVPFKGVTKVARRLGFDYAEAVTGFEFKKRRAIPIIEGVVVAEENEASLLEAYWEAEQDAEQKARAKREERVVKHWTRLIQGLRIRQRLQEQYATKPDKEQESQGAIQFDTVDTLGNPNDASTLGMHTHEISGGGFLVDADDVVEPFHLPKYKYQPVEPPAAPSAAPADPMTPVQIEDQNIEETGITYDLHTMDIDSDIELEEISVTLPTATEQLHAKSGPMTMQELAESSTKCQYSEMSSDKNHNATGVHDTSPSPVINAQMDDVAISGSKQITPAPAVRSSVSGSATPSTTGSTTKPTRNSRAHLSRRRSSAKIKSKRRREDNSDSNESDGESLPPPSPRKRATRSIKAPTVTASTRTLRPRVAKTAAQLREAEEQEKAYRHAIEK